MSATAPNSEEVLIEVNELIVSPILEKSSTSESGVPRELCYKLDWEPTTMSNRSTDRIVDGDSRHLNGFTNATSEVVSNASALSISNFPQGELIIVHGDDGFQNILASELSEKIQQLTGTRPTLGTLGIDIQTSGKLCLFIAELDQNLLSSLTSSRFTSLQKMLTTVGGILWVIRVAYLSSSNPVANMITGLRRSVGSESLLKFGTLDLDPEPVLCTSSIIPTILSVFAAIFGPTAEANCELEYAQRKGSLSTLRIINDVEMNRVVYKATKLSILEPTQFSQNDRPLQLVIGAPGPLETLHFVDQSVEATLLDDEIEVEVKAIGMNIGDLQAASGLSQTSGFGVEHSGVVTKIGRNVTKFNVGNRVACISVSNGVYSSYTRTKAGFAFRIRDDLSFEAAAAIPIVYCTAYCGLVDLGQLLKGEGERVLIHGAERPTGQRQFL